MYLNGPPCRAKLLALLWKSLDLDQLTIKAWEGHPRCFLADICSVYHRSRLQNTIVPTWGKVFDRYIISVSPWLFGQCEYPTSQSAFFAAPGLHSTCVGGFIGRGYFYFMEWILGALCCVAALPNAPTTSSRSFSVYQWRSLIIPIFLFYSFIDIRDAPALSFEHSAGTAQDSG